MKKLAFLFLFPALAVFGQKVPVKEHFLSNGMKVLLVERHDAPSVSGGWVARVGSANERPGITGIAHLFEHMMFKGTPTIGTRNYQKDLEIIAAQEKVRDGMRAEERKMRAMWRRGEITDLQDPDQKTRRWKELEKEFKKLVEEHRKVIVKNEFDRIYTANGGSSMNAYTSYDHTAYFITVPANKLELFMWMESGRLLDPVFREFYAERDVVFEERRMRTESTPTGKFTESFNSLFWESHPYSWPIIGWPSDIPAISKAQADEFYATYYAPQNLTLILVGDFQSKEALAQAEKYFGRIKKGEDEAPDVVTLEMPQKAEKRFFAEAEINPNVDIYYHTPAFGHKDTYALRVLAQVLHTRTGRLHKKLVLKDKLATDTWAWTRGRKYAGEFNIGAEVAEGKTLDETEAALYAQLEKLKNEPVPAKEVQKVKNNFAAAEYRRLSSNHPIMMAIMRAEGTGGWRAINEAGPKLQAVTPADIQRVAKQYFTRENRAVAIYKRKPGTGGGDDPLLAGLTGEQKAMARKIKASITAEKDLAKLKGQLKSLEGRLEQQGAKAPPLMKVVRGILRKRISEMEKK
ncbi:MAG: pitrilysin family protein [Verrucomicrobiota bacterium]|nr:pitrilysin family protein [Verrucomicrobiota bacterium]